MSVRMWIKGNLCALLVRMEVRTATIENSMEVPQKLKTDIPYDSAILLIGIYPKEIKIKSQRDIYTLMFTKALFTISKTWKTTFMSINGG